LQISNLKQGESEHEIIAEANVEKKHDNAASNKTGSFHEKLATQKYPIHEKLPNPWSSAKVLNVMKVWYPLRFKLSFPKKSALNLFEQKDFLQMHAKLAKKSELTANEAKLYKKYMVSSI
jgi:hypothetical protein